MTGKKDWLSYEWNCSIIYKKKIVFLIWILTIIIIIIKKKDCKKPDCCKWFAILPLNSIVGDVVAVVVFDVVVAFDDEGDLSFRFKVKITIMTIIAIKTTPPTTQPKTIYLFYKMHLF